jgi:hypothetical protein
MNIIFRLATLNMFVAIFIIGLLAGCGSSLAVSNPSPWITQVSIAMQAAQQVDKSARLVDITAFPVEFDTAHWDYQTSPLHLEFGFDRLFGNDLTVSFRDTNITDTLKVEKRNIVTNDRSVVPLSQVTPQSVSSILAAVKLSPREAGLLTWQDAQTQATQRHIYISPDFEAEPLKPHVVWEIAYTASNRKTFDIHNDLRYVVDAKTGDILERNYAP